jgi:hypothetical protein
VNASSDFVCLVYLVAQLVEALRLKVAVSVPDRVTVIFH